jgi:hypothetical protein
MRAQKHNRTTQNNCSALFAGNLLIQFQANFSVARLLAAARLQSATLAASIAETTSVVAQEVTVAAQEVEVVAWEVAAAAARARRVGSSRQASNHN